MYSAVLCVEVLLFIDWCYLYLLMLGSIPTAIGTLTNLAVLNMNSNELGGI